MLRIKIDDVNYNVVETTGDITSRVIGVDNGVIKVNNIISISQSKINNDTQVGVIRLVVTKKSFCDELIYKFKLSTTKLFKELFEKVDIDEHDLLNVDLICYNYPTLIIVGITSSSNQVIFQLDNELLNRWNSCLNYSITGHLN
jgi:membrane-bound lytic murein transglycosylase MltF